MNNFVKKQIVNPKFWLVLITLFIILPSAMAKSRSDVVNLPEAECQSILLLCINLADPIFCFLFYLLCRIVE